MPCIIAASTSYCCCNLQSLNEREYLKKLKVEQFLNQLLLTRKHTNYLISGDQYTKSKFRASVSISVSDVSKSASERRCFAT